jgi:hypothetical protein
METVKSRLAEYVMIQNPSRKIRTLEYGTRRRWRSVRHYPMFGYVDAVLLGVALAGVSVALGWFLIYGVVSQ